MRYELFLFAFYLWPTVSAQDTAKIEEYLKLRGEAVIAFDCPASLTIEELSDYVSIDFVQGKQITAYVNRKQYERFRTLGIPFRVLIPPSLSFIQGLPLKRTRETDWNHYPSYAEYVQNMQSFAMANPSITRLDTIGYSVKGKLLLALKISDSAQLEQTEPRVFLTSSIHGDELTGYMLMLHFIDSLLTSYSTSTRIKRLIDNLEIYINPLANPDGTFKLSDSTIYGATRFNANAIDLNRNFPDPAAGNHPDGNSWQMETEAMMNYMQEKHFCLSANFHGGAEVVNYPWDTWFERHPDDEWFHQISLRYADTAQRHGPPGYFTSPYSSGVTNGYDWYRITGGRQDYVTWFLRGREVTIEVSSVKIPDASLIPLYWEANFRSLIGYLEESLRGIHGFVTDSISGKPLRVRLSIPGHDVPSANSAVESDSLTGYFVRLVLPGEYTLKAEAAGYKDRMITITVPPDSLVKLRVLMVPDSIDSTGNLSHSKQYFTILQNPVAEDLTIRFLVMPDGPVRLRIFDIKGKVLFDIPSLRPVQGSHYSINLLGLEPGIYLITAADRKGKFSRKFIKMAR